MGRKRSYETGNIQPNIIIGSAAGFSFMDFVVELAPVVAIILLVVLSFLALVFKKDLVTTEEKMKRVFADSEPGILRDLREYSMKMCVFADL